MIFEDGNWNWFLPVFVALLSSLLRYVPSVVITESFNSDFLTLLHFHSSNPFFTLTFIATISLVILVSTGTL